ncbi:MAG TPA: hypothetical protein VFI13_13905, partial [Gemmatimonadales bacterium]|nr:hypothetical protein [Gemmatimonadales bacterium]
MRRASSRLAILLAALAATAALAAPAAQADKDFSKYAVESASASLSSTQAGAHADFTMSFRLSSTEDAPPKPYAFSRDLSFHLPPGLIGNPQKLPRCTLAQFGAGSGDTQCPQDSQVGITEVQLAGGINSTLIEPVYNMESPGGDIVARFGFFAGFYPAIANVRVDPADYSLIVSVEGAPAAAEVIAAKTTIWGVPAADSHDALRLTPQEALAFKLPSPPRPSGQPEIPFLSNPTDCSLERRLTVTAVSYQLPDRSSSKTVPFPQIGGCGKLAFNPKLTVRPTNPEAFAPTGLDATLAIPQDETPNGLATSTTKSAVVALPEGMSINPAAGAGL